ncbi:hypothetical protein KCTC32516_00398 [Polaribacter huanghezhanensis]|uniref:DUF1573 domain-containing protein n=1 Tax=Polaribacter huanghezhanensis TaxID=1354726 RepID=UPI0026472BA9|nr:DUF1573 domain-containing protein [Polaribacter huanghezhanensis]WKD85060.1 hypothetical protein KCTC32516_00398 [Polaribacter huanghezhanensis]
MKFKKISYLIIIFIISFLISNYFRKGKEKENMKKTSISYDFKKHNFFKIRKNIEASIYFVYKNTGQHPLKIKNIVSTCGCTIPVWSRKELAPSMKDSILVTYDSKETGKFIKSIYVTSNSQIKLDVLRIEGMVLE